MNTLNSVSKNSGAKQPDLSETVPMKPRAVGSAPTLLHSRANSPLLRR